MLILGDKPQGAFYLFADVSKTFQKYYGRNQIVCTQNFCDLLLEFEKVALIPGDSFGMPQYVRISFAKDIEDLKKKQE